MLTRTLRVVRQSYLGDDFNNRKITTFYDNGMCRCGDMDENEEELTDEQIQATSFVCPVIEDNGPHKIVTLTDVMDTPIAPLKWTVETMLPVGNSILAGRPKIGKSRFLHNILLDIAQGQDALGNLPTEKSDVLLLALEENHARLKRRTDSMYDVRKKVPQNFEIAFSWPPLDDGGVEKLQAWIDTHPGGVIGIDTYVKIAPVQSINGNAYRSEYKELSRLTDLTTSNPDITIITVMHTRKMGSDNPWDLISGSTGLAGAADGALILYKKRNDSSLYLYVDGRDIPDPKEYTLQVRDGVFKTDGTARQTYVTRKQQEIFDVLCYASQPLTSKEIAARLHKNINTTQNFLGEMKKDGVLSFDGHGYAVTTSTMPSQSTPLQVETAARNIKRMESEETPTEEEYS